MFGSGWSVDGNDDYRVVRMEALVGLRPRRRNWPIRGPWNMTTIRYARMRRNLTQDELSEALDCRQQTVSEWECGLNIPGIKNQGKLTAFFGEPR